MNQVGNNSKGARTRGRHQRQLQGCKNKRKASKTTPRVQEQEEGIKEIIVQHPKVIGISRKHRKNLKMKPINPKTLK
jgi:hypothetical protein